MALKVRRRHRRRPSKPKKAAALLHFGEVKAFFSFIATSTVYCWLYNNYEPTFALCLTQSQCLFLYIEEED